MWTYAKTDWQDGDWFAVSDYNRIKNNIEALHNQAQEVFQRFEIVTIDDRQYTDYYFVENLNDIEQNIDTIADNTFRYPGIQPTRRFEENGIMWDVADINRIEDTTLTFHTLITNMIADMFFVGEIYSGEEDYI